MSHGRVRFVGPSYTSLPLRTPLWRTHVLDLERQLQFGSEPQAFSLRRREQKLLLVGFSRVRALLAAARFFRMDLPRVEVASTMFPVLGLRTRRGLFAIWYLGLHRKIFLHRPGFAADPGWRL